MEQHWHYRPLQGSNDTEGDHRVFGKIDLIFQLRNFRNLLVVENHGKSTFFRPPFARHNKITKASETVDYKVARSLSKRSPEANT